jgi:putative phage-type endonuclease
MNVLAIEQRSPEWYKARLGRLTGSSAGDMMATIKSGEAAARRNLRVRLALERITGISQESAYQSAEMKRGADLEPLARLAYEARTGSLVEPCGFCLLPDVMVGCSPDGIVGDGLGLLEVKCPIAATHLEYIRTGSVPREYFFQVLHGLWVTGLPWCDFVSYHPDFPPNLRLLVQRLQPEAAGLKAYALSARLFLGEVDTLVEEIKGLTVGAGVAV